MSRTPHPGAVSLLRADGMASALVVTMSWFSAILLAGQASPTALVVTVAVGVGVLTLARPSTHTALAVLLRVLVHRPVLSSPRPRPHRGAPPPPRIALRAVETVRRTRAPGVVLATV
jgi:hypothetical protein